jgi:plasmid stability protein
MMFCAVLFGAIAAQAQEPAPAAAHAQPAMAIVVQDSVALRAAARDSAQQQATLWQGDALEIRGQRQDFLQVYDHRRERAGFVRAAQVRVLSAQAEAAPDLMAVVRFLRDSTGAEALGIGYAAAYLKAAPASAIGAEVFDALGTMADRLARRASTNKNKANESPIAAHLEVVASYGIAIRSFERDGRMTLCYDGEAFRRVLALTSTDEQKARAALALTRPECVDPATSPVERAELDNWRADVLERVPRVNLPEHVKNRLRMRGATVWSSIAFERARKGQSALEAANVAIQELAAINKQELSEDDQGIYNDAAARVGASRWAAEPARTQTPAGVAVVTVTGQQPGETCIKLLDKKHDESKPLLQRCTFGVVWSNSARANTSGTALALAVQPLDSWRELWVFHYIGGSGWTIDVLPPGENSGDAGYIEFAGFVPGTNRMLAAREVRSSGKFMHSFEVLDLETLAVLKHAENPESLSLFYRWQDPAWKKQTVSLR